MRKPVFGNVLPCNSNWPAQQQKLAIFFKFWLWLVYYLGGEQQGADQTVQMCRMICAFVVRIIRFSHDVALGIERRKLGHQSSHALARLLS